jgi:centrosomal protein CEP164
MESVILEEDIDEDYEPTQAEIDEYAAWLGMNRPEDDDLLWVASEGLKAPLPEHWKPCKTQEGEIYYFNFASGESVWDHPCDDYYRKTYEEEKAKKLRWQADGKQKRAGVSAPAKPSASGGPATLSRQPPGGPVGMAALSATKLGPIGSAALAPIGGSSSGPSGALAAAPPAEDKAKPSSSKSPSKNSPNKGKKTRSFESSKAGIADAGGASASSQPEYSRRLSEHDVEVISQVRGPTSVRNPHRLSLPLPSSVCLFFPPSLPLPRFPSRRFRTFGGCQSTTSRSSHS